MRRVREVRDLGEKEKTIAQTVFNNTIPYDKVLISDGLGGGDRPFTLPTSFPATYYFNVSESLGKYVIHAGDGYYGMSHLQEDKETLIHELTHVWQGEHSGRSWDYVFGSAWAQALSDDAYAYDPVSLDPWDSYNPEQQAKIVEDWFHDGMKEGPENDRRFYYIKKHIRGEEVRLPDGRPYSSIHTYRPPMGLGEATLHVEMLGPSPDPVLLPLLKERFGKDDVAGFTGRVRKVEEVFRKLRAVDAHDLLRRLEVRRQGDKVAQYFHDHLSTKSQNSLIGILREK
jgi:hypothetical protein